MENVCFWYEKINSPLLCIKYMRLFSAWHEELYAFIRGIFECWFRKSTNPEFSSRNPESRWLLKSGIQAPLAMQGIRNPRSSDMDSGIPYHDRNPDFRQLGIQNPRLSWKYLTLGEKKSDIHSLLKVHLDFGVVFGTDLIWISVPKEVTPVASSEAPTASLSCAQISCPDLSLTYGEKCRRRSGYEINLPLSKAASARKTESTRAVHALSKYVGTCGQKRERGL